ncbi:MAG: ComF family protein [Clostridia bacterium]|nr:ComF family protein [Clostridia bacterium]
MKFNLLGSTLNFIFPPVCGYCKKISNSYLCESCLEIVNKLRVDGNLFFDNKNFGSHFWIFEYKDEIRDRVIEYKFQDQSYLYRFFVEIIKNDEVVTQYINKFDFIVPVPLHKKRLRKRGYNQTALIAKAIGKSNINVEFCDKLLIKNKYTEPQSLLDKEQREKNVIETFIVNNKLDTKRFAGKSILIFDDVYTTGSTANECARVLKQTGCSNIGVLTIAKRQG